MNETYEMKLQGIAYVSSVLFIILYVINEHIHCKCGSSTLKIKKQVYFIKISLFFYITSSINYGKSIEATCSSILRSVSDHRRSYTDLTTSALC